MLEGGLPPAEWPAIAEELRRGKATDQERAASFVAACEAQGAEDRLRHYLAIFMKESDGTPRAEADDVRLVRVDGTRAIYAVGPGTFHFSAAP